MLFDGSSGPIEAHSEISEPIRQPKVSFVDEYTAADLSWENDRISVFASTQARNVDSKDLERDVENIPLRFRPLVMRELLVALKRL